MEKFVIYSLLAVIIFMMSQGDARDIKLSGTRGSILIKTDNKKRRSDTYSFKNKNWYYNDVMGVVVTVLQPSARDNLTIEGVGQVSTSSCFFLTTSIGKNMQFFANTCALNEDRVRESGCKWFQDIRRFKIFAKLDGSTRRRTSYRVSYMLQDCNADLKRTREMLSNTTVDVTTQTLLRKGVTTLSETTTALSEMARTRRLETDTTTKSSLQKTAKAHDGADANAASEAKSNSDSSVVQNRFLKFLFIINLTTTEQPSFGFISQGTQEATTEVACENCGNQNITIGLSIAIAVLVIIVLIFAAMVYKRKRRKSQQDNSLNQEPSVERPYSLGTSATSIPRDDVSPRPWLTSPDSKERYVFTPSMRGRMESGDSVDNTDSTIRLRVSLYNLLEGRSTKDEHPYELPDDMDDKAKPYAVFTPQISQSNDQPVESSHFHVDVTSRQSHTASPSLKSPIVYENVATSSNPEYHNQAFDVEKTGGYMRMKGFSNADDFGNYAAVCEGRKSLSEAPLSTSDEKMPYSFAQNISEV